MATINKFEDLICWQRARELTREIYKICRNVEISKDRGFCDQIQRAVVSVMSNLAEGFERGTKQELINYFYIAKGSCAEVRCQAYIAYDVGYIDISKCRHICQLADETGRLIESFVKKVKAYAQGGLQYKTEKTEAQKSKETLWRQIEAINQQAREERKKRGETY